MLPALMERLVQARHACPCCSKAALVCGLRLPPQRCHGSCSEAGLPHFAGWPCCRRLAYLSGPSFAAEVARKNPTAVTIASENEEVATRAQELMSTPRFRCYRTTDVIGGGLGMDPWGLGAPVGSRP